MQETTPAAGTEAHADGRHITILDGSQTGNSTWLAKQYAARLEEHGCRVTRQSMSEFPEIDLARADELLVLISTFLNGEPPDSAQPFCKHLLGEEAPRLDGLRYSVLALGDITYKDCFCTIGRNLDARLEELGAERFCDRVECDVDFEETADAWFEGVLDVLLDRPRSAEREGGGTPRPDKPAPAPRPAISPASHVTQRTGLTTGYSRKNPFPARVLENFNLNGAASDRETRHLRVSLKNSSFSFEPGDSLGVYPTNHPRLVDELIGALGYEGDERVLLDGEEHSLRAALSRRLEITVATRGLWERFRDWAGADNSEPGNLSEMDLLDLVREFSLRDIPAQELVSALRQIPPRLYSLANGPGLYPDEAHVAISVLRYASEGRARYGVCSVECAERLSPGDRLPVYINTNPYFRLPVDPGTATIMIGPGTGCAPFRAFLQEREHCGAKGDNWLFFGARREATDFLYREEWKEWQRSGILTRLDTAFSRDTNKKVYVQHRMQERGREIFSWLDEGAHLYVAGDEKRMASAVHGTLLEILEEEGGFDRTKAEEYLDELQRQRRYQRDIY